MELIIDERMEPTIPEPIGIEVAKLNQDSSELINI
jgi:hypothetical protein